MLTVSAAGNCGDKPYCVSSPSSAKGAISVAQTTPPSAVAPLISVYDTMFEGAFFPWTTQPESAISGLLQYGSGNNLSGCESFPDGPLDGKIVLVDRGDCLFSDKVMNIEKAGGKAAIVINNVPGQPFPGDFSGGVAPTIPGYMISQDDGAILKSLLSIDVTAYIDPTLLKSLKGYTMRSSARGPDMSYNGIKPEIAAPGGMLAAVVGTGTGELNFGGTSSASPVVAGAAAILKQWCKDCTPLAIKVRMHAMR